MIIDSRTVLLQEELMPNLNFYDEEEDEPPQEEEDEEEDIPRLESFKFKNSMFTLELASTRYPVSDLVGIGIHFIDKVNFKTHNHKGTFYG